MLEFGSDFHYIDTYNSKRAHLTDVFKDALFLADGRQCIISLFREYGWDRIWMPDYFCYEVIDTIKEQTKVDILFYEDNPLKEGDLEQLPYKKGDVLLRMNYYGLRDLRSNNAIPVPVIEDHSHDPFGHWALYSDADWCISSLRKTFPIPEGGMMWSPKGHTLSTTVPSSEENEIIASIRWEGMEMKSKYLKGEDVIKEEFRKKYTETEAWFDHAVPTTIDERSLFFITKLFDLNLWLCSKRRNWEILNRLVNNENCTVLNVEHDSCTIFSFVILLENKEKRDKVRNSLIENCVYPAILWNVPKTASSDSVSFSERMLSIHCDGRYSEEDIRQLAVILNNVLQQ